MVSLFPEEVGKLFSSSHHAGYQKTAVHVLEPTSVIETESIFLDRKPHARRRTLIN